MLALFLAPAGRPAVQLSPASNGHADITPNGLKSEHFHSNTRCPGSAQGHPCFRRLSCCICVQIWGSQDPLSDTLTCQNSRNSLEHCSDNDSFIIKQMSQEVTSRRHGLGARMGWGGWPQCVHCMTSCVDGVCVHPRGWRKKA